MQFDDEYTAFMEYAKTYPDNTLLLVDTYDTLNQGVPNAIKVFDWLKANGHKPKGIRLDSGDIAYLSKKAREMLDKAGHQDTIICASGDLDENSINSLKNQGATVSLWGVGTKLITSADMPALGGVYKLSAVIDENGNEIPKIKLSENVVKITNPGFKNIYRVYDKKTGKAEADFIYLRSEDSVDTTKPLVLTHPVDRWKKITFTDYELRPLQIDVIKGGKLVYKMPTLKEIKEYANKELDTFWDEYKRLDKPHLYKVDLSDELYKLKSEMLDEIRSNKSRA
jgi:nicotinate phosphoribosyltransferase